MPGPESYAAALGYYIPNPLQLGFLNSINKIKVLHELRMLDGSSNQPSRVEKV